MESNYKILDYKIKDIPESKQGIKDVNELLSDPKNNTRISKVIALYKNGHSLDFIAQIGKEQGWLTKYFTPVKVCHLLKDKGYIPSDKGEQ